MPNRRQLVSLVVLGALVCLFAVGSSAGQAPPPAAAPASSAKAAATEADDFVFDRIDCVIRFSAQGQRTVEVSTRIKVLTDAAVQQLAQVSYVYDAYQATARFEHLEVQKPSGQVTRALTDGVNDVSIQALPDVFTDLHQMRIPVPGLSPGDTVDYRVVETATRTLIPGQFWYQHRFTVGPAVKLESLVIDVPADRPVDVKTAVAFEGTFVGSEVAASRRVYRWKRTNVAARPLTEFYEKATEGRLDPPDVLLTTLNSWDELATWYLDTARDLDRPDAAIRAKAEELTRGLSSPADKMRALFEYVSANCRYLSLSFGIGRMIPHSAPEVMKNQYGDCKDRHTLLSALARAVGLRTYPALINSRQLLEPKAPSFGQFDHMITVGVFGPSESDWVWMDSSTGVAPYGLLPPALRNKAALVLQPTESRPGSDRLAAVGRLVKTPATPPFQCFVRAEVDATLSATGALDARVTLSQRGDSEVASRLAVRTLTLDQRKETLASVAKSMQLSGDVEDGGFSDPASTRDPFQVRFRIRPTGWFDRTRSDVLKLPLAPCPLQSADEASWSGKSTVQLAPLPSESSLQVAVSLPAGHLPKLPVDVGITRDYAEYRSTYRLDGGRLTVRRTLTMKVTELPAARMRDYLALVAAIREDEGQPIHLDTSSAAPLPEAVKKPEADLYSAGLAAYNQNDYTSAIATWKQLLAAEPQHRNAWNAIGIAYGKLEQWTEAVEAQEQQVKIEPFHGQAWGDLGWALQHVSKIDDAIAAYRKQIAIKPLDKYAHRRLGLLLLDQRPTEAKEAASELAKAEQITPDDRQVVARLGRALLKAGEPQKAIEAFDRVRKLSPGTNMLCEIAYDLVDAGVEVNRAADWVQEALRKAEAESLALDLNTATWDDGRQSWALSWAWHAVGWAAFKGGDLAKAERYLAAARSVRTSEEISDHLSVVMEKRGRPAEAIRFAAESLSYKPNAAAHERLARLAGSQSAADQAIRDAKIRLLSERTAEFAGVSPKVGQLDFVVMFTNGSGRPEVRGLSRDPDLLPLLDHLRKATFPVTFPDSTPARILCEGRLVCGNKGGPCAVFLYFGWRPPDVQQP